MVVLSLLRTLTKQQTFFQGSTAKFEHDFPVEYSRVPNNRPPPDCYFFDFFSTQDIFIPIPLPPPNYY